MRLANRFASPLRARRVVQRSNRGCAECKALKAKCDEAEPTCRRCARRGVNCSGVQKVTPLRWSKKHERYQRNVAPRSMPFPLGGRKDVMLVYSPPSFPSGVETQVQSEEHLPADEVEAGTTFVERSDQRQRASLLDIDTFGTNLVRSRTEATLEGYRDGIDPKSERNISLGGRSARNVMADVTSVLATDPSLKATSEEREESAEVQMKCAVHATPEQRPDEAMPENSANSLSKSCETAFAGHGEQAFSMEQWLSSTPTLISRARPWHEPRTGFVRDCPTLACPPIWSKQLKCLPSELVEIYFEQICPLFSTFDSWLNPFRSYVSQTWQTSTPMFYTILSMAAAKVAQASPRTWPSATYYQSLAFRELSLNMANSTIWKSEDLLIVLMLGLSTWWHDKRDWGFKHLRALQHAFLRGPIRYSDDLLTADFFEGALVYWEMATCMLTRDMSVSNQLLRAYSRSASHSDDQRCTSRHAVKVRPHPWSGVALMPQTLFTHVARHILHIRLPETRSMSSLTQDCRLEDPETAAGALEEKVWMLRPPHLHEIANTADVRTPPIHLLLTAEAFILAIFYQLYYIYPQLLSRRLDNLNRSESVAKSNGCSFVRARLLSCDGVDKTSALAHDVVIRLRQIDIGSGTCCHHPLLLLVASGALSLLPSGNPEQQNEVIQMRQFVLDRFEQLSKMCWSTSISDIRSAVLHMFDRLDMGFTSFWMDTLFSMNLMQIID